ncbi:MAG: hypothetical protein AAFY72_08850, partial [Cyanobacteria bacterium J06649_4]
MDASISSVPLLPASMSVSEAKDLTNQRSNSKEASGKNALNSPSDARTVDSGAAESGAAEPGAAESQQAEPRKTDKKDYGIPERLAKHTVRYADYREIDRAVLTPMMRHYVEMKDAHPYALMMYRVGDFFETFFQDAITIARELELVLTSKDAGKAIGRVPLSGIPHHALERYCTQLVEKGYAVAICDQVEDP